MKKKTPDFLINEEGYVNSKMKKKYEEIMARKKKEKNNVANN